MATYSGVIVFVRSFAYSTQIRFDPDSFFNSSLSNFTGIFNMKVPIAISGNFVQTLLTVQLYITGRGHYRPVFNALLSSLISGFRFQTSAVLLAIDIKTFNGPTWKFNYFYDANVGELYPYRSGKYWKLQIFANNGNQSVTTFKKIGLLKLTDSGELIDILDGVAASENFSASNSEYSDSDGRGAVINPPFSNLLDSDLIVVWGRNLSVTSPHIYDKIKNKTFITIDPRKTPIAQKSILHIQIKPKTDYLLALILARFAFMEGLEDVEFLENYSENWQDFFELSRNFRIKPALEELGLSLDNLGDFLHLVRGKKVAFLIGIGVQKYFEGDDILRCIDGLAAILGLFNKNAGGVWYLSDSKNGFENPFDAKPFKTVPKPSVDFGKFDLVFLNGANVAQSMPNSTKVIEGLKKSFVVNLITAENETCKYSDIVLPAKTFLAKNDVRLSYATDEIIKMSKIKDEPNAISEFELAKFLDNSVKDEEFYLRHFEKRVQKKSIAKFSFIDEVEVEIQKLAKNEFYLITPKTKDGLNSQFIDTNIAYFHPDCGLEDGDDVELGSKIESAKFKVQTCDKLRTDCVAIFAGTKNVNHLTTSMSSKNGDCAIFQELKVKLLGENFEDECEEDFDLFDSF